MSKPESLPHSYIRARRADDSECIIDLSELEDALSGIFPGESYFQPDTGKIIFKNEEFEDEEADDGEELLDDATEVLPIDSISSHEKFEWMEEFIETVHSIPLRAELTRVLRNRKPFRNFKDALSEYPTDRERWFQFEAEKTKAQAVEFIEDLDWEIVEVVDDKRKQPGPVKIDLAERLPLTEEEHTWILRGGWRIATRGGRTQLALLLKGSKNKDLLKHKLQTFPAYGRLSFLTLEEIENRIDQVIRRGDLAVEFFGDLPLIVLTPDGWEQVRPWAHQHDAELASLADDKTLVEMLTLWRQRRREEQLQLVDAVAALNPKAAERVLKVWETIAGKDVRSHLKSKASSS